MAARNSGTTCGATEDRATFDTSGHVPALDGGVYYFAELDPFTQGYIEALFQGVLILHFNEPTGEYPWKPMETRAPRFTDLAPETLAAILKDCGRFQAIMPTKSDALAGHVFWEMRQRGTLANRGGASWPPLTATLDDDGKVRLGAQPQAKHREDPK